MTPTRRSLPRVPASVLNPGYVSGSAPAPANLPDRLPRPDDIPRAAMDFRARESCRSSENNGHIRPTVPSIFSFLEKERPSSKQDKGTTRYKPPIFHVRRRAISPAFIHYPYNGGYRHGLLGIQPHSSEVIFHTRYSSPAHTLPARCALFLASTVFVNALRIYFCSIIIV